MVDWRLIVVVSLEVKVVVRPNELISEREGEREREGGRVDQL